ncbi:MAG: amidohydrolase family protein [Candidatus Lokiarchaeota archaeon]|nr:amidohydrolase family protein [Candidatus Lokiarchaeota archaeon]
MNMNDNRITLFYNCKIITMDQENRIEDAMAIFKDKILSIGSKKNAEREIKNFISKNTDKKELELEKVDLNGSCIVPGFIDTHMHPGLYIYFKTQLNLSEVRSHSDLKRIIKNAIVKRPKTEWIIGFDLMEDIFSDNSERHFPTKSEIDDCCSDRPVVIIRHDGHIVSVNSVVLEKIGITKENVKEKTPNFGEIRTDQNGVPNGIFTEEATSLVMNELPIPDFDSFKTAAAEMSTELASYGITTCGGIIQLGEIGPAGSTGAMEWVLLQVLLKEDIIEQDFVFYYITDKPKKLKRIKKFVSKLTDNNRFEVGGLKLFGDGSFGAHTAYLYEPYNDCNDGASGFMVNDRKVIKNLTREALDLGFQVIIHAIGDKGNRIIVDVFKEILSNKKYDQKKCRLRIEHASMLTQEVLVDSSNLGIIMACQPNFINSEYNWLEGRIGSRIEYTYPFRSIIDANIILAAASDAPVESANVFFGLQACVLRKGMVPQESITIQEAISIYTINAAYALGQEKIKGSLEKGKLADFVVLDKDIETIIPNEIENIEIKNTYHRGKIIY